ncbi:transposase [Crossiella sp. CA-258035]|uniref:transposase n=1 Tax=Crossiella sp. CA-258035 TaxID=2981138 RepID=UPI0024BD16B1|nr:transposase [Crossiella sp. CA-258035]WHT17538.1 transposase [Crossiella sp. CA-258035]
MRSVSVAVVFVAVQDLACVGFSQDQDVEDHLHLRPVRWPVERTFAWIKGFRRLRVRTERRADVHQAILAFEKARETLKA